MTTFSLQDQDLFRRQAYIGGHWCDADNGATLKVNNPATGEALGTVPMMGAAETRRAIEAAKKAFADWSRKTAKERSSLLRRWHDLMLANIDDLGNLMTAEQGKPLPEAKGEVAYAASFIEWFAEEAKRVYGDTIPSPWNDRRLGVIKQPIGVCAAMTPWNFPAAMITRNAGQTCVCANRLYVRAGVYDAFAEKLVAAVKKLKVGNGFEPGVLQGPLIDQAAVEKVEEHIQDAVSHGARVLLGGKRHTLGQTFFEPTVLGDVTRKMKVAREETFGPVAPLFRFETDEQAIEMANDTEFGLASYFYSRDVGRIWRAAEGLESGMVGINTGLISNEVAPFVGGQQSGLGREGSHYGIEEFVEIKYLCFGGLCKGKKGGGGGTGACP